MNLVLNEDHNRVLRLLIRGFETLFPFKFKLAKGS